MTTLSSIDEGMPCWVDVMVETIEQHEHERGFLSALFDWTWNLGTPETGYYAIALSNGVPVLGLGTGEGSTGALTTYFKTSDIDGAIARAIELGANVVMPKMQVMDAGSMALMVDPTGATFGLWQPDQFPGFGVAYELNAPGWFDQASADPARAGEFYAKFSGYDLTSPGDDMLILQNGEQWYASISEVQGGEAPRWNPIYVVDTLERIHEVVPRHGGSIVVAEMPVPGSAICVFSEPVNGTLMTVMRAGEQPE